MLGHKRGHPNVGVRQSSHTLPDAPPRPAVQAITREEPRARPQLLVWGAFCVALATVFLVHLPVLNHYFFGDDAVPFADIESKTAWRYTYDLFLMRDPTPNWRFLTGLEYLALYRTFGFDAFPFLLVAVRVHTGTAALVFWLVYRATRVAWTAAFAAAMFGLAASPVPTVGQVTAFNNVLAGFFLMLSVVTIYEGLERERNLGWWLLASVLAFGAAIASNESAAVLAPVPAMIIAWKAPRGRRWWREPRQWLRVAWLSAPYVLLGGEALIAFAACGCTEQGRDEVSSLGGHMGGNLIIYLSRLIYPAGLSHPAEPSAGDYVAASFLIVLVAIIAWRGSALARIGVVWLALSLLSYLTITFALAPRYVYAASIPFSILAALFVGALVRLSARISPALPAVAGVLIATVLALTAWQAYLQNAEFAGTTAAWRDLMTNVEARYPTVPADSAVVVRGGPFTDPIWQFGVMPAYGRILWDDATLTVVGPARREFCRPEGELFVLEFDGGRYTPAKSDTVVSVDCETPNEPG
jgi:hypothetical protein